MAKIKSVPKLQDVPALKDRMIIYPYRGALVARAWPRKRGSKGTPKQLATRAWFRMARQVIKYIEPGEMRRAIEATRNTLIYPADLIMMAMAGNYIDSLEAGGKVYTKFDGRIKKVTYQGCRVELAANVPTTSGTTKILPWTTPSIQTAEIYAPTEPERLYVPPGVDIVEVAFSFFTQLSSQNWIQAFVLRNGSELVAQSGGVYYTNNIGYCATGPLRVEEGDYFHAQVRAFENGFVAAGARTNFSLTILNAAGS